MVSTYKHIITIEYRAQTEIAGDTTLNLADIFPEGKVVAFEMGPPMDILRLNVR